MESATISTQVSFAIVISSSLFDPGCSIVLPARKPAGGDGFARGGTLRS
jgi:hypothetical protein